jgi:serine/threonine-protein kinase RsbW
MEVALHLPLIPDVELVAAKAVEIVGRNLGMARTEVEAVAVAAIEACLNAIEHGGNQGFVVRLDGGESPAGLYLVVEVEDHGGGFNPESVPVRSPSRVLGCTRKRGWGLTLIRELVDEVKVQSQPGLTTIRMVKYGGGAG